MQIDSSTSFERLFDGFNNLKKIDIQGTVVDNIYGMIAICHNLSEIIISYIDLSQASLWMWFFEALPTNFTIYVKNEASKNIVLQSRSDVNVIIGAPTA